MGISLINQERYEEALEAFNKAITINSDDFSLWSEKGFILTKINREEEAIEAFNKALLIRPNDSYSWYLKGKSLNKLGRYEEAIEAFNNLLLLDPVYYDTARTQKEFALNKIAPPPTPFPTNTPIPSPTPTPTYEQTPVPIRTETSHEKANRELAEEKRQQHQSELQQWEQEVYQRTHRKEIIKQKQAQISEIIDQNCNYCRACQSNMLCWPECSRCENEAYAQVGLIKGSIQCDGNHCYGQMDHLP